MYYNINIIIYLFIFEKRGKKETFLPIKEI